MNGNLVMERADLRNARSVRTTISIEQHKIEALHDERAFAMETKESGG